MASILDKTKNIVSGVFDEVANAKIYKEKNLIVTEMRKCTSQNDNDYVKAHINKENKKMYFLSRRIIEVGTILCDEYGNLYQITESGPEVNTLLGEGKITTICSFIAYVPQNPFRTTINQAATVNQTISGLTFHNEGELHLTFEQKSNIEQNITIQQTIDSAEEEMRYRYKPIKDAREFISLINEILNGAKSVLELKGAMVAGVLKQASGVLKIVLDSLIKKVENEAQKG